MVAHTSVARVGLTRARSATEPVPVDETDLALLRELARDARLSQRGLGRLVGMSPPAVGERVTRLERLGVIRGYRAEIDYAALGASLVVYLGVVAVQGVDQREVIAQLRELTEVETVEVVTGPLDLLVRLRVRDHAHLRETLFDRVWRLPGVNRTETFVCLDGMAPKDFAAGLVEALLDDRTTAGVAGRSATMPGRPARADEEE